MWQTQSSYTRYLTSFIANFSENINSENKEKTKRFMEEENKNILKLTLLSQLVTMLSFPQVPFGFKMYWWLNVIEVERL